MSFPNNLNKSLTWITLINQGYLDYTKNFLKSIELNKIDFKLVVFCIDDESYNELKDNNYCICIKADFLKYSIPSDFKVWQNIDYKRICFSKLDVILYALKNFGSDAIGFMDTDVVLFSDPTPIVVNAMNVFKKVNIFAQCDELGQTCSNPMKCKMFCAGILIFRNIPSLYPLLEYTDDDIYKYDSDQHFLVPRLRKLQIDYFTINRKKFMNGSYNPKIRIEKVKIPEETALIHFNYMIGHDKKKAMKLQGLWFL